MNDHNNLEEYEQIFGNHKHENLFDPDGEYYKTLRQEILSAPREEYDHSRFPFTGITIARINEKSNNKPLENKWDAIFSILSKRLKYKQISNLIEALLVNKIHQISPIFYLSKNNIISARGYLDEDKMSFHVLPESTIALKEEKDILYTISTATKIRKTILNDFCTKEASCFRVRKQVTFSSAQEAAEFVLGEKVSSSLWKDQNGRSIDIYYPIKKVSRQKTIEVLKESHRLFYITEDQPNGYQLYGVGYYVPKNNGFVLKKGSYLIVDAHAKDARSRYITNCCSHVKDNMHLLKKDITFSSPSAAAAICLGKTANGWNKWVDEKGKTLKDIYKKK